MVCTSIRAFTLGASCVAVRARCRQQDQARAQRSRLGARDERHECDGARAAASVLVDCAHLAGVPALRIDRATAQPLRDDDEPAGLGLRLVFLAVLLFAAAPTLLRRYRS